MTFTVNFDNGKYQTGCTLTGGLYHIRNTSAPGNSVCGQEIVGSYQLALDNSSMCGLCKAIIEKDSASTNSTADQNQWWNDLEAIMDYEPRILMYGPPGTGKTTSGFRDALKKKQAVYSVTLNEDTSAQEILGHFVIKGGDTKWHDGPAIRAWKEGALLIINEIAEASGPVLTALYAILDDPEVAACTLPNGETVRPAEGFRVIATTNESPDTLPEALDDRFTSRIYASKPCDEAINALPGKVGSIVKNSYESVEAGASVSQLITYRKAKGFGELVEKGVDEEVAARVVFGPRAEEFLTAYKLS